jgi:hypothetical protein
MGQRNRPRRRQINRLIRKYSYQGPSQFQSLKDIQDALDLAIKTYSDFKPRAKDQRWSYLESIAQEYQQLSGKGVQHHFMILQHRDQTKDYFRRIKYCEGKQRSGGVNRIQVSSQDGNVRLVYDKTTIENEIMRVNESKLLQARHTPLRHEQLSILLGEQGDFQKWEQILLGNISLPNEADESLHLWYTYITNHPKHPHMDFTWTTEEYFSSWAKMSEDKMTLPGIQVAHIKCIHPDSESADVISLLALLPFMAGYSPKTWRTGIDSMIPKKQVDLRPDKLRLILLLAARFNHGNKLIGKKMMEYGERHNLLAPEHMAVEGQNQPLTMPLTNASRSTYLLNRVLMQFILPMMQSHVMIEYFLWWHTLLCVILEYLP